jgi:hypothetical protein
MQARLAARVLYNDRQCEQFVKACDKLDESQKPVSDPKNSSYFRVLKEAISQGKEHAPLSEKEILSWHKKLLEEDGVEESASPDVSELTSLCETINAKAKECADKTVIKIISSTAEVLFACGTCRSITQTKHRIESLVFSYLLSYHTQPLILLQDQERERFFASHRSSSALSDFLADKVRERCIGRQGELFTRVSSPSPENATETYESESGERVSVEWHELLAKQKEWRNS